MVSWYIFPQVLRRLLWPWSLKNAGAASALTWMIINWIYRKPSALGMATGAVVGLASVTPASGFISPLSAIVIGVVAAIISYSCISLRNLWKIDESLDVWACHGMGGLWGVIAVFSFILSFSLAKVVDKVWGLSVSEAEEHVGLDISQHGEEAYY